jgi:hypothetical protein
MKPLRYTLIALAATCGFAYAQTTAYTTPVGYVTSYINPRVNDLGVAAVTYIAPSLVMPTTYAGAATAQPTGKTIALPTGVPVSLDSTSMLEIAEGPHEGWWSAITGSTDTSITVFDDFPAGLAENVKVTVRKFTTIQDLFGDNTPGLNGESFIDVLDPADPLKPTLSYKWADGFGWYEPTTEEPSGGVIIYPGTAVVVNNFATGDPLPVVMVGEVKLTKTQVDVFPGENWLGQPNPTGGTLGSMQFASQITDLDDILELFGPDAATGQPADPYIAFEGTMYHRVFEFDASDVPIGAGFGYRLTVAGAAITITIPAQVVSP